MRKKYVGKFKEGKLDDQNGEMFWYTENDELLRDFKGKFENDSINGYG